jgi:hypothetical protein
VELAALAFNIEVNGVLTGEGIWCQQPLWIANICLIQRLALTAAALMEFFLCWRLLCLLPCCHRCVYPSFFSVTFIFRWFNGFLVVTRLWLQRGAIRYFGYTYHWSSCDYVVSRLPVGSSSRIAEDCIIKCISCSIRLYISDWCIPWYCHARFICKPPNRVCMCLIKCTFTPCDVLHGASFH